MTPPTDRAIVSIGEIAQLLAGRAEDLARTLLPLGHRAGNEWVEANRSRGGLGDSLVVCVRGHRAGVWGHPPTPGAPGGDLIDLIAYLQFNGDKGEAIKWARAWLGIDQTDPKTLEDHKRRLQAARQAHSAVEAREREKTRKSLFALWLAARAAVAGTPVERYLLGRGIDLRALGRQPGALRFHPALYNTETDRHWPAMIAGITGPATYDAAGTLVNGGRMVAVHRTWLQVHDDGTVSKAPLQKAKKVLGEFRGGTIRLWRGADNKALHEKPAGSEVLICEGIEDGLTLAMADRARCILVGVSLGALGAIHLPPNIARVTLCADNDGDNPTAQRDLTRAIDHFLSQGRRVFVARPPAGAKDVNELLQREVG